MGFSPVDSEIDPFGQRLISFCVLLKAGKPDGRGNTRSPGEILELIGRPEGKQARQPETPDIKPCRKLFSANRVDDVLFQILESVSSISERKPSVGERPCFPRPHLVARFLAAEGTESQIQTSRVRFNQFDGVVIQIDVGQIHRLNQNRSGAVTPQEHFHQRPSPPNAFGMRSDSEKSPCPCRTGPIQGAIREKQRLKRQQQGE